MPSVRRVCIMFRHLLRAYNNIISQAFGVVGHVIRIMRLHLKSIVYIVFTGIVLTTIMILVSDPEVFDALGQVRGRGRGSAKRRHSIKHHGNPVDTTDIYDDQEDEEYGDYDSPDYRDRRVKGRRGRGRDGRVERRGGRDYDRGRREGGEGREREGRQQRQDDKGRRGQNLRDRDGFPGDDYELDRWQDEGDNGKKRGRWMEEDVNDRGRDDLPVRKQRQWNVEDREDVVDPDHNVKRGELIKKQVGNERIQSKRLIKDSDPRLKVREVETWEKEEEREEVPFRDEHVQGGDKKVRTHKLAAEDIERVNKLKEAAKKAGIVIDGDEVKVVKQEAADVDDAAELRANKKAPWVAGKVLQEDGKSAKDQRLPDGHGLKVAPQNDIVKNMDAFRKVHAGGKQQSEAEEEPPAGVFKVRPAPPGGVPRHLKGPVFNKIWPQTGEKYDRILSQMNLSPESAKDLNYKKTILAWSRMGDEMMGPKLFENCPVPNCEMTSDRGFTEQADVVFFKKQMPPDTNVPRSQKQIWVLTLGDSPMRTMSFRGMENKVNWTASYRVDSTISTPPDKFAFYKNYTKMPVSVKKNYGRIKTKKVAWFVSVCKTKGAREEYVKELKKYIDVDVYGTCGTLRCPKTDMAKCDRLIKNTYKFYLSFENANCKDYITESFYRRALKNDAVPVVYGAHPDDYKKVAPPHSYIHVDDFDSPKDLAKYLNYLDSNNTAYNQYFRWKTTGQFIDTKFWCRLCAMVHEADAGWRTWYKDMETWWRGPGMCLQAGSKAQIRPWFSWRNVKRVEPHNDRGVMIHHQREL